MTIIEAIKSGKAFRRKGYAGYIGPFDLESIKIGSESESEVMLEIFIGDILADDWEVREE